MAIVVILASTVFFMWQDEITTLASMKMLRDRNDAHQDGAVYLMKVKGGFYLDDFVKQGGVKSDTELIDFVTKKLTKDLINIGITDALLLKYIEDSRSLWENDLDQVRYTTIGSVIGTHAGPGAVAVAFFKK